MSYKSIKIPTQNKKIPVKAIAMTDILNFS